MDWRDIVLQPINKEIIEDNEIKVKEGWVCIYFEKRGKNGKGYGNAKWKYGRSKYNENPSLLKTVLQHEKYKKNYDIINGKGAYDELYNYKEMVFESDTSSLESDKENVDEDETE